MSQPNHVEIDRLKQGQLTSHLKEALLERVLPLDLPDYIQFLASFFYADCEPHLLKACRCARSLEADAILKVLAEEETSSDTLHFLAAIRDHHADEIQSAIVSHPNVSTDTLRYLAPRIRRPAALHLLGRKRLLLNSPHLRADLGRNPFLTGRDHALLERYEAKGSTAAPVLSTPLKPRDRPHRDALQTRKRRSVYQRVVQMNMRLKLVCARFGTWEERALLIRDMNKAVAFEVLNSPKLNEREVKAIVGMRDIDGRVLEELAMRREWTRNYEILFLLVKNPKTPMRMVRKLLPLLRDRELRLLGKDPEIFEGLRQLAQRFFSRRENLKS